MLSCRFGGSRFPVSAIPYPEYFGKHPDGQVSVSEILPCVSDGRCDDATAKFATPSSGGQTPLYVFERSFLDAIAPEIKDDFPKVRL